MHKDSELRGIENFHSSGNVGYEVKEKELSKLCKAIWNSDLPAVERYVMKEHMLPDKESRFRFNDSNLLILQNSPTPSVCQR